MEMTPRPGEIFHFENNKPYQVITIATHKETSESMVIYQELHGDFNTYVLPMTKFLEEIQNQNIKVDTAETKSIADEDKEEGEAVNDILMSFLDAESYSKKLEVVTTNLNAIDDRLINDMAVSLDCTIEEGTLDQRLHELIYCLRQMSRFEDRRLR